MTWRDGPFIFKYISSTVGSIKLTLYGIQATQSSRIEPYMKMPIFFAANLHSSGHINDRDYDSYLNIFESMIQFVKPPDLLIYLKADMPKLVDQIQKRGRDFEDAIQLEYLKNLNKHYEDWIGQYELGKLLIVDVNKMDFVANVEDFSSIVEKVDIELFGLFS